MSAIKFVKKEQAGTPGNFKYTYECTCASKKKHIIEVHCANDNEANNLAKMECDEKCGES